MTHLRKWREEEERKRFNTENSTSHIGFLLSSEKKKNNILFYLFSLFFVPRLSIITSSRNVSPHVHSMNGRKTLIFTYLLVWCCKQLHYMLFSSCQAKHWLCFHESFVHYFQWFRYFYLREITSKIMWDKILITNDPI